MKYLSCISLLYSFSLGAPSKTITPETESRHRVDEVQYVTSELYKKFCPLGYAAITDLDTCESAAKVLGIDYTPSKNGHAYHTYDAVCFATYIDYNTKKISQWSTAQVNSNHYYKDAYICEIRHEASPKYVKQIMALDSCPEGYSEITSASTCEEAADFLGYNYVAVKNGHTYSSNEPVCFVSALEWVTEKPQSYSTVQVNSDHYKEAAYICESKMGSATSVSSAQTIAAPETPTTVPETVSTNLVDSNEIQYVTSELYKKFCPLGYAAITDLGTCESAAKVLGIDYVSSKNGHAYYKYDAVCFATYIDYNTRKVSQWSTAQVNSNHYQEDAYICEIRHEASPKYVKQIMALDTCPEGYSEITSASTCEEAADFLGYNYVAAKNGHAYSSNKPVCYVSYLEWYAEKTTEWSTVQVNSDHYKEAAYICESTEASSTSLDSPSSAPDSFMIQKRNMDSCPEGFSEITNTETCLTAAESLGVEYNQSYNGNEDYGEPIVCFASYIDNVGNPNKLLFKSVARINSNHYTFGGWLCKKND